MDMISGDDQRVARRRWLGRKERHPGISLANDVGRVVYSSCDRAEGAIPVVVDLRCQVGTPRLAVCGLGRSLDPVCCVQESVIRHPVVDGHTGPERDSTPEVARNREVVERVWARPGGLLLQVSEAMDPDAEEPL